MRRRGTASSCRRTRRVPSSKSSTLRSSQRWRRLPCGSAYSNSEQRWLLRSGGRPPICINSSKPRSQNGRPPSRRRTFSRSEGASVAAPPLFLCRLACCISRVTRRLLLGFQCGLLFGLFGCNQRLEFILLALGLGSKLGLTRSLGSPFGLTLSLRRLARGLAYLARIIDRRSGSKPLGDSRIFGRGTKLFQHCLLGCCSLILTLVQVGVFVEAH